MVKQLKDIKKVQILCHIIDDEVHYLERNGTKFLYTYMNNTGNAQVNVLNSTEELEIFIIDLYKEYISYYESVNMTINVNSHEDLNLIKCYLNV